MTDALNRLRDIVRGIDRDETESDDGWWETSTGADYGAEMLGRLEGLVAGLDAEVVRLREGIAALASGLHEGMDHRLVRGALFGLLLDGPRQEGNNDG